LNIVSGVGDVEDVEDEEEGVADGDADASAVGSALCDLQQASARARATADVRIDASVHARSCYTKAMLTDEIKTQMTRAMKDRDEVARNILSLARGEIQTAEARANRALRDDEAQAILRKLVKANEETLAVARDDTQAATLRKELSVLVALLPATLSVAQIVEALASQRDAIRTAKNDGQATGIAMKHLKSTGASVEGTTVAEAVKQLRA
jgi:uncharacterized protein YqeY